MLDPLAGKLEQYMDLLSARQKLVASNIANADTPGYKTQDIDFQTRISKRRRGCGPHVIEARGLAVKNDGNNVSLDREARLLAENALRFNMASNLLRDQIRSGQAQPFRKARADEPVLAAIRQRFGHGGAARPRRAAGGESGQRRNHAHSRRRPVPPQGRGLRHRTPPSSPFASVFESQLGASGRRARVAEVVVDDREPERRYLPGHPDADKDGYVAFPRINPAEDMVDLMGASRSYQANVAAISPIKDMIQRSIDLLR